MAGCPYCDHPLKEFGKSNYLSLSGENEYKKSLSPNRSNESVSSTFSRFQEKNYLGYLLIACMTLPFLVIIALLFLRVFSMFFEIIF